jgi:glycosyltransferase involved in cell wall biosynthesis
MTEKTTKMKSAYIARLNLEDDHLLGVAAKIHAQVKVLSNAIGGMDLYFLRGNEIRKNDSLLWRFGRGALGRRLAYRFLFYPRLARELQDHDFVYIRYQGSSPPFLYLLRRLKARKPEMRIFVEIPTFPYDLVKVGLRQHLLGLVDRMFRGWLRHHVDRVVTFSRETSIFGIPAICTDNGVDVGNMPMIEGELKSEPICLLGVANVSFWHGYDRVIKGLAGYYSQGSEREIKFLVAGVGAELENLKKLAADSGMKQRVEFLGARHGQELDALYAKSHVGLATLGMHRCMIKTTSLKTREYCARGLPFVLAGDDPDFPPDFAYAHEVPATDEPLDIPALLRFMMACGRPGRITGKTCVPMRGIIWAGNVKCNRSSIR